MKPEYPARGGVSSHIKPSTDSIFWWIAHRLVPRRILLKAFRLWLMKRHRIKMGDDGTQNMIRERGF